MASRRVPGALSVRVLTCMYLPLAADIYQPLIPMSSGVGQLFEFLNHTQHMTIVGAFPYLLPRRLDRSRSAAVAYLRDGRTTSHR